MTFPSEQTRALIAEANRMAAWVSRNAQIPNDIKVVGLLGRLADALEGTADMLDQYQTVMANQSHALPLMVAELHALRPRVVTSVAELDALPHGVIVVRAWRGNLDPDLWLRVTGGWRDLFDRNDDDVYYSSFVWSESATFTVLWVGGTE